jgi:hypothetical protein
MEGIPFGAREGSYSGIHAARPHPPSGKEVMACGYAAPSFLREKTKF